MSAPKYHSGYRKPRVRSLAALCAAWVAFAAACACLACGAGDGLVATWVYYAAVYVTANVASVTSIEYATQEGSFYAATDAGSKVVLVLAAWGFFLPIMVSVVLNDLFS